MGLPIAWSTILVEILGGLAAILGAFVTLASLPMAAVLLVAMFTVHLPYGFSSIKLEAVTAAGAKFGPPGYEVSLLYLACLAALVLGGPGPLTMARHVNHRPQKSCAVRLLARLSLWNSPQNLQPTVYFPPSGSGPLFTGKSCAQVLPDTAHLAP
jgi:hypothetical protein